MFSLCLPIYYSIIIINKYTHTDTRLSVYNDSRLQLIKKKSREHLTLPIYKKNARPYSLCISKTYIRIDQNTLFTFLNRKQIERHSFAFDEESCSRKNVFFLTIYILYLRCSTQEHIKSTQFYMRLRFVFYKIMSIFDTELWFRLTHNCNNKLFS